MKQTQPHRQGFAKSRDGTKIWYQVTGTGRTIVFCNGMGCPSSYWKHVHAHFKHTHRVVLFDWRGHDHSGKHKSKNDVSVNDLTHDLYAVIKKLKIKKAVIAGHSMGTQVLFDFYNKYPERVEALISCCGTYENPLDTFYNSHLSKHVFAFIYLFNHIFPRIAAKIGLLLSLNPFWFQMGSALKMLNPGLADKTVLREYLDHFTSLDPVFLAEIALALQEYSARDILPKVKVPVLIIAGEQDAFTPLWLSQKMHQMIPHSEMLTIKKASHVALIEQPALINLRMEKFFQERLG